MKILHAALCAALVLASFLNCRLAAQVNATASFSGQVTDPTGAAIGGATVKVTNRETGAVITRQAASDGNYTVPLLKPGEYSIEVAAPGFAPMTRTGIVLQIQQVAQEDF